MSENVNLIIQIIAAGGVIVSVVYLAIQINQQNKITRAQFGHTLTQRQYDRYFASSRAGCGCRSGNTRPFTQNWLS